MLSKFTDLYPESSFHQSIFTRYRQSFTINGTWYIPTLNELCKRHFLPSSLHITCFTQSDSISSSMRMLFISGLIGVSSSEEGKTIVNIIQRTC